MTPRTLNSKPHLGSASAFSLVEVIIAIGILAIGVVAIVGVSIALGRSASTLRAREQAIALGSAIEVALVQERDAIVDPNGNGRLEALASQIPVHSAAEALRFVASVDGLRVVRESEARNSTRGLAVREQYFLIEVRQRATPLVFVAGGGFLALSATVRCPYQLPAGANDTDAVVAPSAAQFQVIINLGIGP